MNWTPEMVAAHQARIKKGIKPGQEMNGIKARGNSDPRLRKYKSMAEQRFNDEKAWPLHQIGEVLWYDYECWTFQLPGEKQSYTPDFVFLTADLLIVINEIKGGHAFRQDIEKFKTAAGLYPFFTWRLWDKENKDSEWVMKREY